MLLLERFSIIKGWPKFKNMKKEANNLLLSYIERKRGTPDLTKKILKSPKCLWGSAKRIL